MCKCQVKAGRGSPESYLDDWGRCGEEPPVLGEVLYPERGGHDEQLEGQVPLWKTVW